MKFHTYDELDYKETNSQEFKANQKQEKKCLSVSPGNISKEGNMYYKCGDDLGKTKEKDIRKELKFGRQTKLGDFI